MNIVEFGAGTFSKPGRQLGGFIRGQLDGALKSLGSRRDSVDTRLHEARKCLKKARAGLRILDPDARSRAFRKGDRKLRDIAAPLGRVRDAGACAAAAKKLEAGSLHRHGAVFAKLQKALIERQAKLQSALLEETRHLSVIKKGLAAAGVAAKSSRYGSLTWKKFSAGLIRGYKNARRALKSARKDPSAGRLHAWRKVSKVHRYQMELIVPVWPEELRAVCEELHRLTDLLGEHHDLSVLSEILTEEIAREFTKSERAFLSAAIVARRRRLSDDAMQLGRMIFAEKPREFMARISVYARVQSLR